jgi:hypothetical protein
VLYVLKHLDKNLLDVFVVQGIEHGFAFFAPFDDPKVPQVPKLVRDGGLPHVQHDGQIVNAEFFLREGVDDLHAGGVAKRLENIGKSVRGSFPDHLAFDCCDVAGQSAFARILAALLDKFIHSITAFNRPSSIVAAFANISTLAHMLRNNLAIECRR